MVLGSQYETSETALKSLHWLPVRDRVDFKVLCLVQKSLNKKAPVYLRNLLQYRQYQCNTRASSSGSQLTVPFTRKATFASRAFSVYGPTIWNQLPPAIRGITDFKVFKRTLKTHFFKRTFKCWYRFWTLSYFSFINLPILTFKNFKLIYIFSLLLVKRTWTFYFKCIVAL